MNASLKQDVLKVYTKCLVSLSLWVLFIFRQVSVWDTGCKSGVKGRGRGDERVTKEPGLRSFSSRSTFKHFLLIIL